MGSDDVGLHGPHPGRPVLEVLDADDAVAVLMEATRHLCGVAPLDMLPFHVEAPPPLPLVMALEAGQEYGNSGRSDAEGRFRVGVEHDKAYALTAQRPLGEGERSRFDAEEIRFGRVPRVIGGAAEVRIVMPGR